MGAIHLLEFGDFLLGDSAFEDLGEEEVALVEIAGGD